MAFNIKGKQPKGAAQNDLNTVPWLTKARPYLIMAPSLLITIGILIPFGMAIFYSLTNYSFRLPKHSFVGFATGLTCSPTGPLACRLGHGTLRVLRYNT